jgi:hypothetical protein
MASVPLKQTPKVISNTGTLRKPTGNGPKPSFQGPLLPTPKVVGSGTVSHPNNKGIWK